MRIPSQSRVRMIFFAALVVFFAFSCVSFAALSDQAAIEYHYQNGVKYYNRGLYEKAQTEFEKTLSLDPAHGEAKEYLEKVKVAKEEKKGVDEKKSDKSEVRELYDEAKELYAKRDYEAALEVFRKILEIKPIDDFASFYKERCEIFISRALAKEKKAEEQKQLKEKKQAERLSKKKDAEMKKLLGKEEKPAPVEPVAPVAKKPKPTAEERKAEKLKAREERLAKKNESIAQKQKEKEEKKLLKQEQKEEKLKIKEAIAQEKQESKGYAKIAEARRLEERKTKKEESLNKKEESRQRKEEAKHQKEETRQEVKNVKETFVEGVQHYGRRRFSEALVSFQAVIDAESDKTEKTYTDAAKRMMQKAKKRLKELEK